MVEILNKENSDEIAVAYTRHSFYPWQASIWHKLFSRNVKTNHFPHALLFNGAKGIGKKDLAFYLSKGLLCDSPVDSSVEKDGEEGQFEPCHHCRSCQLFSAANHPDIFHLTTPEDKKIIPVDRVRELIRWSTLNSQLGGKKVIVIEPAEAMNLNAANSLLKTLEEPVSNTFIILLTNKKQALLATIRSRCQTIDLVLPEKEIALLWLQHQFEHHNDKPDDAQIQLMLSLANGSPLIAIRLLNDGQLNIRQQIIQQLLSIHNHALDPIKVADDLTKSAKTSVKKTKVKKKVNTIVLTAYDVVYWLDSTIIDLVRLKHNDKQKLITNIDYFQDLLALSSQLQLKKLLQLSVSINQAYYDVQGSININLLFEQLFIDWKNCRI